MQIPENTPEPNLPQNPPPLPGQIPAPTSPLLSDPLSSAPPQESPLMPPPQMPSSPSSPYNVYSNPPAPPQKSKLVPCLIGCGCGGPVLLLIFFMIIGALFGKSKTDNTTSNTTSNTNSTASTSGGNAADFSMQKYLGKWQSADGTSLWIRADGKGDFDGGSTNVKGGTVTLDAASQTLSIKFLLLGKTWKIDAPPHESNGQTLMTLGGTIYRRTAGFDASSVAASTPASGESFDATKVPSPEEQRRLADETVDKFDDALGAANFKAFHAYCAKEWQDEITAGQMQAGFQEFIDKKIRVADALNHDPTFSPPAKIGDDGRLTLQGVYPSEPMKIYFRFSYAAQNSAWKLVAIHISVGHPLTS